MSDPGSPGAARSPSSLRLVGILLAAGAGVRFGGGKLLAKLDDGTPVGMRALATLSSAVDEVIAVVRPGDAALGDAFAAAGARVTVCADADSGMGRSVAHGIATTIAMQSADAVIVALGDMPWVSAATVRAIAAALERGASLVVPRHGGRRGNPVGFGRRHFDDLMRMKGDRGARELIESATDVAWLDVDDPGIIRDVDTVEDLRAQEPLRASPTGR